MPAIQSHEFLAAAVQFDIRIGRVRHNLSGVLKSLEKLAKNKVKLAVLPEMWTSSTPPGGLDQVIGESEEALHELRKAARKHRMVIVGSTFERERSKVFNTAYVIESDGSIAGAYRKIHLFTPAGEDKTYTAGNTPLLAKTSVGALGVTICYDLRFPELYRNLTAAGAEIMIVPAQWPGERLSHWSTLLRARAIENQVYVIGCNRTGTELRGESLKLKYEGGSTIIDPWGEVLAQKIGKSSAITASIRPGLITEVRKRIPVWDHVKPQAYRLKG